jgi:hypothetical protein
MNSSLQYTTHGTFHAEVLTGAAEDSYGAVSFSKQFPTKILFGLLDPQHALLSIKKLTATWRMSQHHIPDNLTPHVPASLF